MARAAVLIGVNRTGKLPKLDDAVEGAKRMEIWALAPAQAMKRENVLLFTDENAPVNIAEIRRAIRKLVESGTIEQLIVYFAGHGVNIRYNECWLLSDAPVDASAAVSVDGSVALARYCGIPHVVLISDACRTAADGVQAQGITGGEIFPNDPVPGPEGCVDIFFGTTLGRPALEVKNPTESSGAFEAIYTSTLLDALRGRLPAALGTEVVHGRSVHVVRPRPLKTCLLDELPKRLARLGLSNQVSQIPDARITSDDDAWVARFDELLEDPVTRSGSVLVAQQLEQAPEVLESPFGQALQLDPKKTSRPQAHRTGLERGSAQTPLWDSMGHCGFEVRGARVIEAIASGAVVKIDLPEGTQVRVEMRGAASSVLLVFEDGSSALLPALSDQGAMVSIDPDEGIFDVAYEPTGTSERWPRFAAAAENLRSLRRLAASETRDNTLRIDKRLASLLPARLQYGEQIDPSLALYVAYALYDAGLADQLRELTAAAVADLGSVFLDFELVTRLPSLTSGFRVPLLARGWSLQSAFGIGVSPELDGLRSTLRDSLWTHFNQDGTLQLMRLFSTGRF